MPALLSGISIFLSAFLLFQLQPMIAKAILPWFGGSAAVWGMCLVFFQAVLFLGYLYAHLLTHKLSPKWQWRVHGMLLLGSVALLPVLPSASWKPSGTEDPSIRILLLLAATVGLPYFLLSSTSPLIQAWYSRSQGGALPYRYFALSNAASLAALLGYPVLVEPFSTLRQQGWVWSGGYLMFGALCLAAGWFATRASVPWTPRESTQHTGEAPTWGSRLMWVILAAFASILSLAVTNHLTQNVASIPFLWVLPLAVYLLTFILCFESDAWYPRKLMLVLHAVSLVGLNYVLISFQSGSNILLVIGTLLVGMFLCCMFCHGELARRKPSAAYVTQFYLMISLGGALGALTVGVVAPYVLAGSYELPLALAACAFFSALMEYKKWWVTDLAWVAVAVAVIVASGVQIQAYKAPARVLARSFYGSLRVVEANGARSLIHGVISHGMQFSAPEKSRVATAYFAPGTGVERAIEAFRRPGQRVGVIGLGIGTLAAYGQTGDTYRFYEINPQVIDLARSEFTFLSDSRAKIEIVTGDGRLSLEREAPNAYDVFVIDAFSGDSIPVHLLSREAMELYLTHVRPDGILAFHVSNNALTLAPVVKKIAVDLHFAARNLRVPADRAAGRLEAEWVLVAREEALLERPEFENGQRPFIEIAGLRTWTDDYSTLFPLLK